MLESMTMLAQAGKPNPIILLIIILGVGLVALAIGLAIYAVLYRAALKWVTGLEPSFGTSMMTVFLLSLIGGIQNVLFRLTLYGDLPAKDEADPSGLIGLPITFAMLALVVGAREELSFSRSCLVVLAYIGVAIFVGLIMAAIILAFVLVAGG